MTRRRRLGLLVLAAAALGGLGLARLPALSARLLERGLSSLFQRPARVGEIRFHLLPLEIEILRLEVGSGRPGSPPFLEVPRIAAVPSLAPLWGRRVVLSRLRLERPKIRINAFPEGGDDIPKLKRGGGGGIELRVRRLAIQGGEFELDHRRVPLELDLPDFGGRLGYRRGGILAGSLSFGPGSLRFGQKPPLRVGTDLELSLQGGTVTVEKGRVWGEGTDLVCEGQIRLPGGARGEFELSGPVDLEVLDRHVLGTGFNLKGAARWQGQLAVEGSQLRLRGRMEGTGGEFDGVSVPRFSAEVVRDEHGVKLSRLELAALGGTGTLDLEVPPGPAVAHLEAAIRDIDVEATLRWIFDLGAFSVGASATGDVSLAWPRGRFRRELSGAIGVDLAPRPDGRTPASGRFEWRAERGVQRVEKADLRTASTTALLSGRIETDDSAELQIEAHSRDVAAADELLRRLRRALGAADAQLAGLSGEGSFQGRWGGTLQVPVIEGHFTGQEVGYLGVVWGRAEWTGTTTPDEVRSSSLLLSRGGSQLRLAGRTETGYYGERDGVDVRVQIEGWPAEDLLEALGWRLDMKGPLRGEAVVTGRRSAPRGTARVACPAGRYYGIEYRDLELDAEFKDGASQVRRGRVGIGGGRVEFRGSLSDDGIYDGAATAREVEVSEMLGGVAAATRPSGRVSGELVLTGPLDRPRLRGKLSSQRLFLGDEGLGSLDAALTAVGDGSVKVEARCVSPRVDLALRGRVGLDPVYTASLRLEANRTSLDPFFRSLYPALPSAVGIVATGEVEMSGPLRRPAGVSATARVASLLVQLPDYPIRSRGPLRLALRGGAVRVEELGLSGEGTDLTVEGEADLLGGGPLALNVRGEADLRALQLVTRRLRGQGAARLVMSVGGTAQAPRVEGTLSLDGAGLRARGFPHGLEGLRGGVRFSEEAAELVDVRGSLGGGEVEVEGRVGYAGGRLASVDLRATGRSLALRFPEGLRSLVDADLRLFGDATRQWLAGAIDVRSALWSKRYDLASELLALSPVRGQGPSLREGLHLDLRLRAPGTLQIDNNLATLHARADLSLQGTSDDPVVLGRAEIDRGRVYFQGNTYTIRRGAIDFANPRKIDPAFDIEAESQVRSYRVTLKVSGTLERVYPTLSSDPPLSAVQILNLLAGAEEATVASLTQSQSDQAKLAAAGAATLAAGRLSEEVGLERQAERLFGLNRFSIDPALVRGNVTNPTARLTVGKRLGPDLSVVYSIDLGGSQERLLSVEYTLSDRLSVLMSLQEPGGLGFDVRVRQSR